MSNDAGKADVLRPIQATAFRVNDPSGTVHIVPTMVEAQRLVRSIGGDASITPMQSIPLELEQLRAYAVALREATVEYFHACDLRIGFHEAGQKLLALAKSMDGAHAERKCGVEGLPQPAGGHSKSGGSQNSPPSTHLEFQSCTKVADQLTVEELRDMALEFAARLCETHGRQLVTEEYRQIGRDMASRIRSRKGDATALNLDGFVLQVGNNVVVEALLSELDAARGMIGRMCSEGRPPTMSIPARPTVDEDFLICDTLSKVARFLREHHLQSVAGQKP
jgi:hypothetical protein